MLPDIVCAPFPCEPRDISGGDQSRYALEERLYIFLLSQLVFLCSLGSIFVSFLLVRTNASVGNARSFLSGPAPRMHTFRLPNARYHQIRSMST